MRQQTLVLGVVDDETLQSTANLEKKHKLSARGAAHCQWEPYHGVLAHQDNTLATETHTDLVHLLRADIVDTDNEDGAVLIEKALQLLEVSSLGCGPAPHVSLFH